MATESVNCEITQQSNDSFKSFTIPEIKDYTKNITKGYEQSSASCNTSSVTTRMDGSVNISAGLLSHMVCHPMGSIDEVCCHHKSTVNTYEIETEDIIINKHKLNRKLYELADWKKVSLPIGTSVNSSTASSTNTTTTSDSTNSSSSTTTTTETTTTSSTATAKKSADGIIGGLTMLGTVLTKSWEPNLKRYVLIRRLVNIPMFSPKMGN